MMCIYHTRCFDGWAAAFLVKKQFPNCELVPASYGDAPPTNVAGKTIFIVDFTYRPEVLATAFKDAKEVWVLDHHHTAIMDIIAYFKEHPKPSNLKYIFDYDRSGVGLVWDHLYSFTHKTQVIKPNSCWQASEISDHRPVWIEHVQNRDLRRFHDPDPHRFPQLHETNIFMERLGAEGFDMDAWATVLEMPYEEVLEQGRILWRYLQRQVNNLISGELATFKFQELTGVWLNVPYYLADNVADVLTQQYDFCAFYHDIEGKRKVSLRSRPGVDVSIFAEVMGGGGHGTSAGFQATLDYSPLTWAME